MAKSIQFGLFLFVGWLLFNVGMGAPLLVAGLVFAAVIIGALISDTAAGHEDE